MSQARDRWIKRNGYSRGPWANYYTPERAIRRNDVIAMLDIARTEIVQGKFAAAWDTLKRCHAYQQRYFDEIHI